LPSCESVLYSSPESNQFYGSIDECLTGAFVHLISPSSFQYTIYTEQFNPESYVSFDFIAGLGGTLSVLLGIDIILIIEFCIFTASFLVDLVVWLKSLHKKEYPVSQGRTNRIGQSANTVNVQSLRPTVIELESV